MKFKIDENLPNECADLLVEAGHEAQTVHAEGLQGAPDSQVVVYCQEEDRILITLDRGFGNLTAYPPKRYPGFIVLQPHRQDRNAVLVLLRQAIAVFSVKPLQHHLWIVEEARVRIRGSELQ